MDNPRIYLWIGVALLLVLGGIFIAERLAKRFGAGMGESALRVIERTPPANEYAA
jgi:flagellar biogenesis protein FliO